MDMTRVAIKTTEGRYVSLGQTPGYVQNRNRPFKTLWKHQATAVAAMGGGALLPRENPGPRMTFFLETIVAEWLLHQWWIPVRGGRRRERKTAKLCV
ncbi:hypothetical protein R6Q59_004126 [Mikania micrantha]